ncbi:MAG: PLP-dependent aminotransferase family protein [Oceanospirillaceae bacterium]
MSLEEEFATLSLHLELQSAVPLYLQLANQLKKLIKDDRLHEDQRLPSSRKLSQLLSISRTSSINAYDQLIAEGYLVARPSSGVFVSGLHAMKQKNVKYSSAQTAPIAKPIKVAEAAEPSFAFDSGPDVALFPFDEWARCSSRVWRKQNIDILRAFPAGGYEPLKQAVTNYLKVLRNLDCQPEQVIITAGSRDALTLIATAALFAKKAMTQEQSSAINLRVALEDPSYSPLQSGFAAHSSDISYCPIDAQGACLPDNEIDIAWLTPTCQYPLGAVMSTERKLDWLALSQQHNSWIVEDDYDSEYQYQKPPLATFFALSNNLYSAEQQRVIYTGGFSKVLFRTLRMGYIVVPLRLISAFHQAQDLLGNVASLPTQTILADFLINRRFYSHLRKTKKIYQQRRDYLHQLVTTVLSEYYRCELPSSGMHLLLRATPGNNMPDTVLHQQLAQEGIIAAALSNYYFVSGQQGLILGYSGATQMQMQQGIAVMQRCLQQFHTKIAK